MNDSLVFVSTDRKTKGPWEDDYVFVEWGQEFRIDHASEFPSKGSSVITTTYGPMALQFIRENGGSAFLPQRIVRSMVDSGELFMIEDVPVFEREVYTVHLETADSTRFEIALQGLRYVSS